jgi:DNA-binding transcriptional ArsR family regulator
MIEGPSLTKLATLMADPSRNRMLGALLAGQALTATELADAAGVGRAAASAHLAGLTGAGLLAQVKQGRHRYYRLASEEQARALEELLGITDRLGFQPLSVGPRDASLRDARVCYDHMAGAQAVALLERLLRSEALCYQRAELAPGPNAQAVFGRLGLDLSCLSRARRVLCRSCLDWSERRDHLAGTLGAALLELVLERRWAQRLEGSRALIFSPAGAAAWAAIGR